MSTSPFAPGDAEQGCTIITPSYHADLERVIRLCASIDRHFQFAFEHILVVPQRDMAAFAALAAPHRKIISKQSVLQRYGFHFLPVPRAIAVPGLFRRRFKEQWFHRSAGRISGWAIQQIIKLFATTLCDADVMMFIDSDVEIIRNTAFSAFVAGEAVRLHEHDAGAALPSHRHWRQVACDMIGAPRGADTGRNYIGHMIVWRRDTLIALQQAITAAQSMPWWLALAREKNFSEYILYGTFVRHACRDGHHLEDLGLVHSLWVAGEAEAETFRQGLTDRHVAVHVQSTLPISNAARTRILEDLVRPARMGEQA